MMSPSPDLGYSHGAKIFKNVEAMQAKELVAKEYDTISKVRLAIVGAYITERHDAFRSHYPMNVWQ